MLLNCGLTGINVGIILTKRHVLYHYSLKKKILGVPKYFSNYFICDVFNAFTFEHFINFKCINFLFWQVKCRSPCFAVHRFLDY